MAVMLTQWSPVPWSGETVSRPPLPPPDEGAAPTPIYETLVREWSQAGRTVPGQARQGSGEAEEGGDRCSWPAGAPAPAPADAGGAYDAGLAGGYGSGYGDRYDGGGYGGGHSDGYDGGGQSGNSAEARSDEGPRAETEAAQGAPGAVDSAPRPPAWERVGIL